MLAIALALLAGCGAPAAPASPTAPVATAASVPVVCADPTVPAVVAKVGDRSFTAAELDLLVGPSEARARVDLFEAREGALQHLIDKQLLETEAKKRGVDVEGLLKAEVEDKLPPPTDAELESFYNANVARIRQPLDEVKDQIRSHLAEQKMNERLEGFLAELQAATPATMFLEAPRFDVAATGPRLGPADAPVQIIEFSDFQCPYCSDGAKTIKDLRAKYGDKVSIVYRNFPLPSHTQAHRGAEAALCASDQGKFWEYADVLFENQRAMGDPELNQYAKGLALDEAAFSACLTAGTHSAQIDADQADGEKVGMNGTPGWYINGRAVSGARPLSAFSKIIDAELARLGR